MKKMNFSNFLRCQTCSVRYSALMVLFLLSCRSALSQSTDGQLWDNLVNDNNRPSGIMTNQQGNYVITLTKAEHLAWYAWKLNTETNTTELSKFSHAEVKLGADIDLNGHSWHGIGETSIQDFQGTFDGQGHTVRNMICDRDNGEWASGLFDNILSDVEIKNVRFSSCRSYNEKAVGIVAGSVTDGKEGAINNVKFTNIVIDSCSIAASEWNAGFVVGDLRNAKNVAFNNITVRNCKFGAHGSTYGGIVGGAGWGDCSMSVNNCFISVRNESGKANYRTGGILGYMDYSSNLDVDNCVIDMYEGFFTDSHDQGAIVGAWGGTSKPKASHVLVVARPKLPNGLNVGLFAGWCGSSSAIELSDCFIHHMNNPELNQYQIVSKQIADKNRCLANNIMDINEVEESSYEASCVVKMNRNGACFGINPSYTEEYSGRTNSLIDFVLPLDDPSKGKLLGFEGRDAVSKIFGGVASDFTITPDFTYGVMAQGQTMYYTVKDEAIAWVIADNTTNMTDKKRTGKWTFSGIPTGEGELKFTIVERPKIYPVDNECKYNTVTQRVTLKWQVENADVFKKHWKPFGKWNIYRNDVLIDSLDADKDTWTDFAPVSGYSTYKVYFVSEDYMYDKEDNKKYFTKAFTSGYNVHLTENNPVISNGKIVNTVGIPNASILNGSRIRLLKWDTARDIECNHNLDNIIAKASQLKVSEQEFLYNQTKEDEYLNVSFEEEVPASSMCTNYYYLWLLDNINDTIFNSKMFHSGKLQLLNDTEIRFRSFSATKGKNTSEVSLKWNTENRYNESLRYVIERKIYGEEGNWIGVYETTSGLESGSYDDKVLPGYVYDYRIRLYPFCESSGGTTDCKSEASDIGFAASRGTIQGRVTFNSGKTNVEGVDVRLQPEDDELAQSMTSYAMQFTGSDQTMPLAEGLDGDFWNGEWTLQFLLRNDSEKKSRLLTVPGEIYVNVTNDTTICLGSPYAASGQSSLCIHVNYGTYEGNYIILQHTRNGYRLGRTVYDNVRQEVYTIWTEYLDRSGSNNDVLRFGRTNSTESFLGAVDEIRLWEGNLSDKSIADTYNRYLSGNEKGLMAYYTFDSGVGEYAFDSSHPSGNWNNRDVAMPENRPLLTSVIIPESSVLAYRGITDSNGEYTISGIPFEGEGTNWQIVPSYGAHDFSPASTRRLVSTNTLVHAGIDFTDISSFKVKGKVYYEHTNIPVQGCNILIDGVTVNEGKQNSETDADGEFCVDVPIGTHTLSMSMNGHSFTDSLTMYFNKEVHDLWFYDKTKAIVAGRVVGGELEYAKPIGLADSKNNIGSAYITLKPANDNYYFTATTDKKNLYIVPSTKQIDYDNPLKYSNDASAHTGKANSDTDMGDANRIYIKTDSQTGEFAASLPPMRYEVVEIKIPTADEDINSKLQHNLDYLDARNTTQEMTDSVWTGQARTDGEKTYDKFAYNTIYKKMVSTPVVLEVWQTEEDKNFFGEDSVSYIGNDGKENVYVAYSDGQYTIGAEGTANKRPVFNQFGDYVLYIKACQKYVNRDDSNNILVDEMPMAHKTVSISNAMSYENYWYVDENGHTSFEESEGSDFELDSLGCGVYKFKVGVPNTTAPFEETLSMVITGEQAKFNLTGIVLGAVSYGNSFVTRGPDVLSMILRDPPGSKSYATWTKGSTVTTEYRQTKIDETHKGENTEVYIGFAPELDFTSLTKMKGKYGAQAAETQDHVGIYGDNTVNGFTQMVTTTQDISTSSAPEFDGPDADLFIGSSVNSVSGNGKQVTLLSNADGVRLGVRDVKTSAFTFNTSFVYSQYQIKKSVIPNLLAERRRLIEDPATLPADNNLHYVPKVDFKEWQSMTDEEKDKLLDKGAGEGYEIKTHIEQYATDSVDLYKVWADDWKNVLRRNEKAKVDAFAGNYMKGNYTFDAGSSQTFTTSTDEMKIIKDETDLSGTINDAHVGVKGFHGPTGESTAQHHYYSLSRTETRNYKNEENKEVLSFILAENGANDILTVDRMTAPDGFSDIFRTRSGQTSAFWAPKYVTEYYQPGTEIMAPTLMVNKPKLELVDPTQQIVSNVRRGTAATIQFRLVNESEAKCNGYYRVCLEAESNRNGARCTLNGNPMNNEGVLVWLEYGQPQIIAVNVEEPQNPVEGTHKLRFYLIDDKQTMITGPMKIYPSEVEIQVDFVKTSSEINLVADRTVINGESVRMGNGKVRFTLKDYDLKMENLLYIDLQQWNGNRFISLGESARWEKKDGLTESVDYTLDMSDINTFPDKEYRFRARTVSNYGEGEVEAYSDEIVVMKDVSAPQPVGNIRPLRGVFNNSGEISVEFNEDIDGGIGKHTNVELYGELLQNASAREVSVFFNGKDEKLSTDIPVSALQDGAARSFNLWLKWMGGEGTILSLGTSTNSNRFGVDAEGHFVVSSNNDQIVSVNTFEKNKWMFLSLVADATVIDCPTSITASYILEDGTDIVWLIGDKDGGRQLSGMTTPAAPFVLGKGFHGYIQDLGMWDGVRDMETSNNEKSIKKTRFTPNLMAYWPLNEGKGTTAKEVVSEQNMYLSSEGMWSIENKNYAMRLNKGQKAQLVFSRMNTNYDEDYLLQAWFNVDKNDNDNENEVDTLISYPNGTTSFVMSKKTGNLVLKCKKDSVVLGDKNIADGHWHQLSFMVKKSENGNAVVYLDGNNVGQISAKKVDAIQGVLFLGDKSNFSGYFDEIRLWNGLQNSQAISENINNRYSTTDCPIAAYFPFEASGQNQAVDFTLGNYGNMKAEGDTVRLVITEPNIPLSQRTIAQETEIVPPLKNVPTLVTRDFSVKQTERKIWIELSDKEKREVQGTTLTALLRGLHDKAGNTMQDIRWSFFVEMNDIEWAEFYTGDYNEKEGYLGYAQIRNNTSSNQSWQINGAPDWMEFSICDGVIKPQETITISIKAKENIPIGINNGMLSLIDANGISHKKYYSISNIPNSPDWTVDSLYSQVMTVTGQVRINNVIQENDSSKLAAFNTLGECIGVATPKYTREKNSYYYTMMIHGNDWYIGKEVTFKFYDASTGTYYASVEPTEQICFGGDYANIGSIEAPIYWDTTGKIEQIININEGWNWISFNTQEESPVEEVFENPQPPTIYTEVKDKDNFARYYNGKWEYDDDFEAVTHSKMYKVKAEGSATITRIGTPINQSGSRIGIVGMANGNPGWSWIGANISTNMALTTAMGGLTSQATVGDIIKNHNQFAEYTTSGWIGDLNTIIPGKGYMYMSNDETKKYLIYPNNSNGAHSKERSASAQDDDQYAEYGGSATVIAAVESDGIRMDGCKIYAVDAEGNIHGCKAVSDRNGNHLAYLVVHGNEPETIKFRVETSGTRGEMFESTTTLNYYDGLSIGTSDEPFIIDITGATDITGINAADSADTFYDLSGRPVSEGTTLSRGIYIRNNKKEFVK